MDYCSLTCFKDSKHSRCTELFYRNQVKESLSAEKFSEVSDERAKMMKILEKLNNYEEEEEADSDFDPDPLSNVNLDEMNLDDLSVKELEELIGEKHLRQVKELLIQGVSPDWLKTANLSTNSNKESPWFIRYKPSSVIIYEDLPDYLPNSYSKSPLKLENLTKKTPSDFLWNTLLEIAIIYVFIYSHFTTEDLNDKSIIEVEVKPITLELCSSLQKNEDVNCKMYFTSALEALESSKSTIFLNSYAETDYNFKDILTGVLSLLKSSKMCFIMLKDILSWFENSKPSSSDYFFAEKKLIFLFSWFNSEMEQSKLSVDEILKTLSNIVEQFKDSLTD